MWVFEKITIFVTMNPCIAIIDSNTLAVMGLKEILWELFPDTEILCYGSIDSFFRDCNRNYLYYFVSARMLFENSDEFSMLRDKTIATSAGPLRSLEEAGYRVLDISLPETAIAAEILRLHRESGSELRPRRCDELSAREKDVLAEMVKGLMNKEIADKLNISTPTVIFHRNNICEKLGTRAIGRLTIYAVLEHIVELDEIMNI